jgi:hypothetical protein
LTFIYGFAFDVTCAAAEQAADAVINVVDFISINLDSSQFLDTTRFLLPWLSWHCAPGSTAFRHHCHDSGRLYRHHMIPSHNQISLKCRSIEGHTGLTDSATCRAISGSSMSATLAENAAPIIGNTQA